MKCTGYFRSILQRPDRAEIKMEWIAKTLEEPELRESQSDGRIRRWRWIEERQHYLRVITLEDGETVHNAFFDRRFKGDHS